MTVLLALPQNETHVQTLKWIAPVLAARGVAVRALDLATVYHQATDLASVENIEISSLHHRAGQAFYRLHPLRQMRTVYRLAPAIRRHAGNADIILVFNDGAVQRVALREARRVGRLTAVLLDGMISDYRDTVSLPRRALRRVGRVLADTQFGALFPSEIGMSPADRVFVMGSHSAQVLRRRGASAAAIVVSGLPRFPEEGPARVRTPARLLYLTGAFGWHGASRLDVAQIEDVRMLATVASEAGMELTVRVHPRDNPSAYDSSSYAVVPAARPLRDDVEQTDIVISLASTGLLEAIAIGRVALTLGVNAPWDIFSRSFASDPIFGPVRSRSQLRMLLRSLTGDGYLRQLSVQRAGYRHYASPGGHAATEAIVSSLVA